MKQYEITFIIDPVLPGDEIKTAGKAYETLLQNTFEQMFTAASPGDIRETIMARTATFGRERGEPCLCSLLAWDAAKFTPLVQKIKVPVLNLQTTTIDENGVRRPLHEGEISRWGEQIQRSLTHAELIGLTGIGHFPMLDEPQQTNRLLSRFISSL